MTTTLTLPATPRRIADLPAPPGLPLLGNLLQLKPEEFHNQLEHWAGKLGTPYRLQAGPRLITVWSDTELMQTVLRERPERYRRTREIEDVLTEMGGNGLFSVEGAAWKPQRRLVMQALAATNFRGFFPTLHTITERLYRRLLRAAVAGEVLDMGRELKRYTVDVTCALAFGQDPNTLEQDGDVIQDHLELIFPMIMQRIANPFAYWRVFRLPKDRKLDRGLKVVHGYVREMMAKARQRMRDDPSETPRNLLEAMLAVRDQPDSQLSDDDVAANVLTLLLAGEDTTATSLAWTMPYLAADQALQSRLHGQAREVFGTEVVCPTHDDLRHLDLFEALTTEATRLHPIAAINSVEPLQDVVLDGVEIPQGTRMFFINRPALRDSRNFAQAERYDPERWTRDRHEGPGSTEAHNPRAFLQFGAGPRVCPGRHLAGVEIRLVLSMLMRHFEIELACDPAEIKEVLAFALTPSKMPVRLKARMA